MRGHTVRIGWGAAVGCCEQKRQQRCWKGAGSGSGVVLDSIVKLGILRVENALEATDSDLRIQ